VLGYSLSISLSSHSKRNEVNKVYRATGAYSWRGFGGQTPPLLDFFQFARDFSAKINKPTHAPTRF